VIGPALRGRPWLVLVGLYALGVCHLPMSERLPRAGCHVSGMIGRLQKTVIDCPDPRALAELYCHVLGMTVNEDIHGWVVIGSEPGLRQLAFQRVTEWVPHALAGPRVPPADPPGHPGA
jgi:hypothetical protein